MLRNILHASEKLNVIEPLVSNRDVTKFEFELDNVRTSNIFNRFKIWRMFQALCYGMWIHGKIFVLRL